MKQKYYYLIIPESGEQLYFAIGPKKRQLIFKDRELTISNTVDRFPPAGSFLFNELQECDEECFNYWFKGAIVCLDAINWGNG